MSRETYGRPATGERWRRLSPRHLHRLICGSRGSPHAPCKFACLRLSEGLLHKDAVGLGVPIPSGSGWPAGEAGRCPQGGLLDAGVPPPPQVSTGTPGTGGAVRGPGPSHAGEDGHRVSSIRHLLNRRRRASAMCQALAWTGGRPAWLVCTSCRFLFKCHLLDEAFPVAPHLKSPNPLFIADAVLLCQYPLRSLLPFLWAGIPSVCSLPAASTCVSF